MTKWTIPVQVTRRNSGAALVPGTAPLAAGAGGLASGQLVFDAVANILYVGAGDDGVGNSTSIVTLAGTGAYNTRGVENAQFLIMN